MEQKVLELLSITLHTSSNDARNQAYKEIEALQSQFGYCQSLCHVSLESSIPLDIRHLATILLRSMVEKNWGLSDQPIQKARLQKERSLRREFQTVDMEGKPLESIEHEQIMIHEEEKNKLRGQLVLGLHLPEMKMKVQFALMLGVLVKYDFPHQMPNFLSYLIEQIETHSTGEQGAALCLEMIIHPDFLFDTDQMEKIVRQIVPFIWNVYRNENNSYSDAIRKSMVMIMFSIINWIVNHRVEREDQTEGLMPFLQSILPHWISQFISDLGQTTHTALRICILQVLCLLVYSMPQTLFHQKYIHAILPQAWKVFVDLKETYQQGNIFSSALQQPSTEEIDFNCGTVYLFQNQILLLLELFHAVLDSKVMTKLMYSSVSETVYILVHYMQYTNEQMDTYEFEEEQYVIAEQESKYCISSLSVRSSAGKLLNELLSRYSVVPDIPVMEQAAQSIGLRLQETAAYVQNPPSPHAWKIREASLYACSRCLRYFLKHNDSFKKSLPSFVEMLQRDLQSSLSIFLNARAILTFAKTCKSLTTSDALSIQSLQPFLQCISSQLCAGETSILWIASLLSTQRILESHYKDVLTNSIDCLLRPLAHIATNHLQAESLLLSLDALITFIRHSKTEKLSGEVVGYLIGCALKLWQAHSQDSYINSYVLDILQAIIGHSTEEILGVACREGVPLIQQVFQSPELEAEKATAIELFEILVRGSSIYPGAVNERGSILSNLLQACFPALMHLLMNVPLHTDMILSSGTKCIFAIFHHGLSIPPAHDAPALTHEQTNELLQITLQYTQRLLSEEASDLVCMDIGPLLSILLIRCPSIFERHSDLFFTLLHAVVLRLQRAQMFDVQQGLISVVGRFLCMNAAETVHYLISKALFEPLVCFWVREYPQFCEEYVGKLSILSFAHFLFTPASQQVLERMVISVQTESASNRVTRATAKKQAVKDEFANVPAPNRLLQLLMGELLQCVDNEEDADEDCFGDEFGESDGSYDEDNEWDPLADDGEGFYGMDDLLDQPDDDLDGLSPILLKLDPITSSPTKIILRDILQKLRGHSQLFQMGLQRFSQEEQQQILSMIA